MDKRLINFEIDEELRKRIKKEAYELDLSVSATLRYIIEKYFNAKEEKDESVRI